MKEWRDGWIRVLEPVPAVRVGASQRATTNHSNRVVVRSSAAITPLFVLFASAWPTTANSQTRTILSALVRRNFVTLNFRNAFREFETVCSDFFVLFFVFFGVIVSVCIGGEMNAFALLAALGDTTSSFQDLVESKTAFSLDLLDQDEFLNEVIAHQPRLLSLYVAR